MQDRVSRNPGRVLITPEDGSTPFYAVMTRADNPEVEGTKINKNALLKDATAALFGLGSDAVPDDVLAQIKNFIDENYEKLEKEIAETPKIATGTYAGTGNYGDASTISFTLPFEPYFFVSVSTEKAQSGGFKPGGGYWDNGFLWSKGGYVTNAGNGSAYVFFTESGKTLTLRLSNSTAATAINRTGITYRYIAIGI